MVITERDSDRFGPEDFAAVIPQETAQVRELYATGVLRQIWLREDTRGACFLLEAESMAEAEAVVATLPVVRKGMSYCGVIPLTPYRGFGPR